MKHAGVSALPVRPLPFLARHARVLLSRRCSHAWRKPKRSGGVAVDLNQQPLASLRGVGPSMAEKLAARGLLSVQDLWLHLPRQYEDRTALTAIRSLQPGVAAQPDHPAQHAPFQQRHASASADTGAGGRDGNCRTAP